LFYKWWSGTNPPPKPPTWRTSVLLLVWFFSFGRSCKEGLSSSYTTADTALRILRTYKPLYPVDTSDKVEAFWKVFV